MLKPPVATMRESEVKRPLEVAMVKCWSSDFATDSIVVPVRMRTLAASHSRSRSATISWAERSQKSWPRVFSW
jgi:hypothetical protein